MKKSFIIFSLILMTFMISGCGCSKDKKEDIKTVTCKLHEIYNNYTVDAEYTINYNSNDDSVIKIVEKADFKSDDSDTLTLIKQINDLDYKNYSDLNGGMYSTSIENDNLNLYLELDFKQINIDDFTSLYSSNQYYVVDGKINLEKCITKFEKNNFECE